MHTLRFTILLVLMSCGAGPGKTKGSGGETPPPSNAQVSETNAAPEWTAAPDQDPMRLKNKEGARIYLLPVQSSAEPALKDRYLLRITGSHSPHDGLVLLVQRKDSGGGSTYMAQLGGRPWGVLEYKRKRTNPWSGFGYNFENRLGQLLITDESFDSDELVRLRVQQAGTPLREFETLTFETAKKAQNEKFAQALATASKACGPVKSSIDWSTVQDGWQRKRSIAETCGRPLDWLATYCERHPEHIAKLGKVITISCKFDGDPNKAHGKGLVSLGPANFIYSPRMDISAWDSLLQFFREEIGGSVEVLRHGSALLVIRHEQERSRLYRGEGGTFYPIPMMGSTSGRTFAWRRLGQSGEVSLREGKWALRCGKGEQALEQLWGAEAQAALRGAKFEAEPKWKRAAYFLARDSRGTYYYVDRYQRSAGGGHYRVFVGRKGQMTLSKLKRLVEDSEGTLFSTSKGDLRLIISSNTMSGAWIRGKKVTKLTTVNLERNRKLIYDELGVYYGEKFGLACE